MPRPVDIYQHIVCGRFDQARRDALEHRDRPALPFPAVRAIREGKFQDAACEILAYDLATEGDNGQFPNLPAARYAHPPGDCRYLGRAA